MFINIEFNFLAPPHGIGASYDSLPDGCPLGNDPLRAAQMLGQKKVTLYTIGCEPSLKPYKDFFTAMAFKTGGHYVSFSDTYILKKVIVGGLLEDYLIDKLMAEITSKIHTQDKEALSKTINEKLVLKGRFLL